MATSKQQPAECMENTLRCIVYPNIITINVPMQWMPGMYWVYVYVAIFRIYFQ